MPAPYGAHGVLQVRGFSPPLALLNGLNHGPARHLVNAMTVVAPPTTFLVPTRHTSPLMPGGLPLHPGCVLARVVPPPAGER
jgi:hypothetical protein